MISLHECLVWCAKCKVFSCKTQIFVVPPWGKKQMSDFLFMCRSEKSLRSHLLFWTMCLNFPFPMKTFASICLIFALRSGAHSSEFPVLKYTGSSCPDFRLWLQCTFHSTNLSLHLNLEQFVSDSNDLLCTLVGGPFKMLQSLAALR